MTTKQKLLLRLLSILFIPVIIVISVAVGFWTQLSPPDKTYLLTIIAHNKIYLFFCVIIFFVVAGYIAKWMLFKYFIPLDKLIEDAEILKNANLLYTIETKGAKELKTLAGILSRHAYELKEVKSDIAGKITQAKTQLEEEKNILVSLVSELNDGIIICNNDGQIILINNRAQIMLTDKSHSDAFRSNIGIGRSIYKTLPREILKHAFDEIDHKTEQGDFNIYAQLVYSLPSLITARIRIVPVLKDKIIIGYILILYDITSKLDKDINRFEMMDSLVNLMRSSVANIRAAIETITGYKDMEDSQREKFQAIITEEVSRLSLQLNETIEHYKDYFNLDWPLEQIQGLSLLNLIKRNVDILGEINLKTEECPGSIWISVENFSFVNLIIFLLQEINRSYKPGEFLLQLTEENNFIYMDLSWKGLPIDSALFESWMEQVVQINETVMPFTVNEVITRHNSRIWCTQNVADSNIIRILLRPIEALREQGEVKKITYGTRPEFYDFDLFSHPELLGVWENVPLSKLKYVVFDAETTGLSPSEGDEIISLGAVRIVNGKILSEQYEQLVNPGRKISKVTKEITGITDEMLKDKPLIENVLPAFHSYCEDAVLVAHNAAFDMRFLQLKEKKLGITFNNPVLDTLLLSASIHINQESHSLDAIAGRFGLPINGRHTALGDALVTAEILLKLIPLLADKGIETLEQAFMASQKTYYARIKY